MTPEEDIATRIVIQTGQRTRRGAMGHALRRTTQATTAGTMLAGINRVGINWYKDNYLPNQAPLPSRLDGNIGMLARSVYDIRAFNQPYLDTMYGDLIPIISLADGVEPRHDNFVPVDLTYNSRSTFSGLLIRPKVELKNTRVYREDGTPAGVPLISRLFAEVNLASNLENRLVAAIEVLTQLDQLFDYTQMAAEYNRGTRPDFAYSKGKEAASLAVFTDLRRVSYPLNEFMSFSAKLRLGSLLYLLAKDQFDLKDYTKKDPATKQPLDELAAYADIAIAFGLVAKDDGLSLWRWKKDRMPIITWEQYRQSQDSVS